MNNWKIYRAFSLSDSSNTNSNSSVRTISHCFRILTVMLVLFIRHDVSILTFQNTFRSWLELWCAWFPRAIDVMFAGLNGIWTTSLLQNGAQADVLKKILRKKIHSDIEWFLLFERFQATSYYDDALLSSNIWWDPSYNLMLISQMDCQDTILWEIIKCRQH